MLLWNNQLKFGDGFMNELITEEIIERFSACDYCGTRIKIGPTEDAETLCPKCGAKRHEVIEKKVLHKQVPVKKEETPQPQPQYKGGFSFNNLGKILLYMLLVLLIGVIVYIVKEMT